LRVITGTAKGKPLKSIASKGTRPTSDKIKEAIFSVITFMVDIEGAVVLDLFAGTGQLGIEALSRGAEMAYFADNNPKAVAVIRENLEYTKLADRSRVDRLPYNAFLRLCKAKFDVAFIDPPYGKGIIENLLPILVQKMNSSENLSSVIVCEHEKELCLPEKVDGFEVSQVYNYGSKNVTIYVR
jgi:16S rRNA (guanine(966)-N(2))-methyltransferase RsmD